jgi:hypothetical protein
MRSTNRLVQRLAEQDPKGEAEKPRPLGDSQPRREGGKLASQNAGRSHFREKGRTRSMMSQITRPSGIPERTPKSPPRCANVAGKLKRLLAAFVFLALST